MGKRAGPLSEISVPVGGMKTTIWSERKRNVSRLAGQLGYRRHVNGHFRQEASLNMGHGNQWQTWKRSLEINVACMWSTFGGCNKRGIVYLIYV